MREPTSITWARGLAVTSLLSLAVDWFLGTRFSIHEILKLLSYGMLITTVGWLFTLARWHRGILKG